MTNPTGKKLEKIIFKLFDDASQGVDRYNHNDSLWLIFTNEMKWVVEFTKDQTLWYNYGFFKDEMELIGLDCVENKGLIQKWFESRFLDIPKVEDAFDPFFDQDQYVEDTIQNGVKHTHSNPIPLTFSVEDTIQNGVKHTSIWNTINLRDVEDTIQNGVKQTELSKRDFFPKDTIQNGVKHTRGEVIRIQFDVEDTVQNGVKHTNAAYTLSILDVEDTIQNGIKDTKSMCGKRGGRVGNTIQIGVKHTDWFLYSNNGIVEDTIQNGVKETTPSGYLGSIEMKGKVVHQIESPKQNNEVEDTIQNGVKETIGTLRRTAKWGVDDIIQNGVKETHDDCSNNIARVEGIVRIGEKLN